MARPGPGPSATRIGARGKPSLSLIIISGTVLVLLIAMALDTRVVRTGSSGAMRPGEFSPASYGASEFPKVQSAVASRAVDAATLAAAIGKDQSAAEKQYGVAATGGTEFSVKFTGKAGKPDFGVYGVDVPGLPGSVHITVQTGPAILGTDLRDATGTIKFGQFKNQIVYQNAGSALNMEMKKQVLSKIAAGTLTGKTVSVVGAFQLTDPNNWQVTPVKLSVP